MLPPWAIFVNLINCLIMRKLLLLLFLLGTMCMYSVAIEGYVVRNGLKSNLFTEEQPRQYAEIGIRAGESVQVHFTEPATGDFSWECVEYSSNIALFGAGRFSEIQTQPRSQGSSAVYRITDKDGFVLTLAIFVY